MIANLVNTPTLIEAMLKQYRRREQARLWENYEPDSPLLKTAVRRLQNDCRALEKAISEIKPARNEDTYKFLDTAWDRNYLTAGQHYTLSRGFTKNGHGQFHTQDPACWEITLKAAEIAINHCSSTPDEGDTYVTFEDFLYFVNSQVIPKRLASAAPLNPRGLHAAMSAFGYETTIEVIAGVARKVYRGLQVLDVTQPGNERFNNIFVSNTKRKTRNQSEHCVADGGSKRYQRGLPGEVRSTSRTNRATRRKKSGSEHLNNKNRIETIKQTSTSQTEALSV